MALRESMDYREISPFIPGPSSVTGRQSSSLQGIPSLVEEVQFSSLRAADVGREEMMPVCGTC